MDAKHTPTPFRVDGLNLIGADGTVVAYLNKPTGDLSGTAYRDAAFIVAACNAYDTLVAALKLAAVWTEAWPSDPPEKIAADNAVHAALALAAGGRP